MSILRKIYDENYDPDKSCVKLPFSLRLKERAFWDAIEEGMGAAFAEHHRDTLCKVERCRDYANFREGFRLGVALMMELM